MYVDYRALNKMMVKNTQLFFLEDLFDPFQILLLQNFAIMLELLAVKIATGDEENQTV